jgi:hypothetical protein
MIDSSLFRFNFLSPNIYFFTLECIQVFSESQWRIFFFNLSIKFIELPANNSSKSSQKSRNHTFAETRLFRDVDALVFSAGLKSFRLVKDFSAQHRRENLFGCWRMFFTIISPTSETFAKRIAKWEKFNIHIRCKKSFSDYVKRAITLS